MKEWFTGRPRHEEPEGPEFWWDETHKVFRRVYKDAEDMPMESEGSYEVVEQTKYGPVLKRRSEHDASIEVPNYTEPLPVEHPRYELREPKEAPLSKYEAMKSLFAGTRDEVSDDEFEGSLDEEEDEEDVDHGRRNFLRGTAGVGATVVLGAAAAAAMNNDPVSPEKNHRSTDRAVSFERSIEAPAFFAEVEGYEQFARLRYDEVLFVDDENRPIGEPLPLEEFVIMREKESGERAPYKVSPGPVDELGILTGGGIAGEWLAEMRIRLKEQYPNITVDLKKGKPRVLSINGKFHSAVYDSGDPEIVAAIASGEIVSYIDIVNHYALRKTPETNGRSIREFIEENIAFESHVPATVAQELRRIIPGLCAQESNFNNEAVSKSGARGIFQFMPATWGDYDKTGEGIEDGVKSLQKQVENAGAFFSDLYTQVQHHAGDATMEKLRALYGEAVLERDVLVPLMVNAYNAGGALIGEALRLYVERHDLRRERPSGKDLFIAVADFARESEGGKYLDRYGNEAREYVPRIYANANVLHEG